MILAPKLFTRTGAGLWNDIKIMLLKMRRLRTVFAQEMEINEAAPKQSHGVRL